MRQLRAHTLETLLLTRCADEHAVCAALSLGASHSLLQRPLCIIKVLASVRQFLQGGYDAPLVLRRKESRGQSEAFTLYALRPSPPLGATLRPRLHVRISVRT